MRFIQLADLHLGRKMNGFSLIEDQQEVLDQVCSYLEQYEVDALILAGDVYDKKIPPEEAVTMFDAFVSRVSAMGVTLLVSSGNHDSVHRLGFGNQILEKQGMYVSYPYNGSCKKAVLKDEFGLLNVYLLPFIKPVYVRSVNKDCGVETYTDALQYVIDELHVDTSMRNIMVSHQFVGNIERCDEETLEIGGLDQVDCKVYDVFDYVALGHIHKEQHAGRELVRYSGSIYPYSFSNNVQKNDPYSFSSHVQTKYCTLIDVKEKGNVTFERLPFKTTRTLRSVSGLFDDVMAAERSEDYVSVVLKDEMDIPNAFSKLKSKYPNIMEMRYDNTRTKKQESLNYTLGEEKSILDYCLEFYSKQNNQEMNDSMKKLVIDVLEKIEEERQ